MYVCAKRDLLQMDCLSSEDLKEENNCSLTFNPTLNFHACPVWMCSGTNSRVSSPSFLAASTLYPFPCSSVSCGKLSIAARSGCGKRSSGDS